MSVTEKKSNYREDYPGYQGFIPYKYSIIGKNVGARNEAIKSLLTDEPPKDISIKPGQNRDFSHYNRDFVTFRIIIVIITMIISIEVIL